jgi:hypothetical protein
VDNQESRRPAMRHRAARRPVGLCVDSGRIRTPGQPVSLVKADVALNALRAIIPGVDHGRVSPTLRGEKGPTSNATRSGSIPLQAADLGFDQLLDAVPGDEDMRHGHLEL